MHIDDLLRTAAQSGASDLHLKVGSYPMMRVNGMLVVCSEEKRLERADTESMADAMFTGDLREKFRRSQEVDLAYSLPGVGRFRCNVFQQRGTIGLALRVIPTRVKTVRRARASACAQDRSHRKSAGSCSSPEPPAAARAPRLPR